MKTQCPCCKKFYLKEKQTVYPLDGCSYPCVKSLKDRSNKKFPGLNFYIRDHLTQGKKYQQIIQKGHSLKHSSKFKQPG